MPSLAIGLSLRGRANSAVSPASLFAASEPGAWYDPSDLTTLFQDSAGATPVTTAGQTVGKMLDKSGRGNHATQATLAQRPTYGINPITGTRNLLTFTEQLDNAAWTLTAATVTANAGTAPDGTLTAEKLIASATAATHSAGQNLTVPTATTYTGSVYVKAGGYNFAAVLLLTTFAAAQFIICDLTLGTIITTSGSPLATSITAVGNGWYRISITQITNAAGTANIQVRPSNLGTTTFFTGDGTSGIYAWGAQLEVSATATAYQKVVSQYEVTEAGIASASYISFDGVDDGTVTGTITPGIDKVQVFAGVRKLSDAAAGFVVELSTSSTSSAGSFGLLAPSASLNDFQFRSGGTNSGITATAAGYSSPTTRVLTGIGDISGDLAALRIDGSQVATSAADQGTGNYLAYPLYIGRRAGTSFPFNGRIYSLIVRFGANLTAGQIASTEAYVNGKTGAY